MPESPDSPEHADQIADSDPDLELLERSREGDREAFRELYTRYYHPLMRFIYRMTGQLELAQEAVNDVMLVLWKNGDSFAGRSKLSTWIMGIAYRKALKQLEKAKRWSDRHKQVDFSEWHEPSAARPELTTDLRDLLEHGIKQLPLKQRAVVELTYYYGYSYEEIAAIVDCPVNTVKTRMFHARAKLKAALPGLGLGEGER